MKLGGIIFTDTTTTNAAIISVRLVSKGIGVRIGILKGLCQIIVKYYLKVLFNMTSNSISATIPIAAKVFEKADKFMINREFAIKD